jgi:hypothetical protein
VSSSLQPNCSSPVPQPSYSCDCPVIDILLKALEKQKKLYKTNNSGIESRGSANSAGRSSEDSYAVFSHDKIATSSIYACLLKAC